MQIDYVLLRNFVDKIREMYVYECFIMRVSFILTCTKINNVQEGKLKCALYLDLFGLSGFSYEILGLLFPTESHILFCRWEGFF